MPDSADTDKSDIRHPSISKWDTDPLNRPAWVENLLRELPQLVDGYEDFITHGTVNSGRYLAVPTLSLVTELKGHTVVVGTKRQPSTIRNATAKQIEAAALR